jgi:hypothetical protein
VFLEPASAYSIKPIYDALSAYPLMRYSSLLAEKNGDVAKGKNITSALY